MSLEAEYKTQIRIPEPQIPKTQLVSETANIKGIPCLEILQKAMEKVVRDRGGVVTNSYSDCEGKDIRCLIAIRTRDFSIGVGVRIDRDGIVTFLYDAYSDKDGIGKSICDEICQNYAVIAVMRTQKKHGFNVEDVTEERTSQRGKRVTVTGVK